MQKYDTVLYHWHVANLNHISLSYFTHTHTHTHTVRMSQTVNISHLAVRFVLTSVHSNDFINFGAIQVHSKIKIPQPKHSIKPAGYVWAWTKQNKTNYHYMYQLNNKKRPVSNMTQKTVTLLWQESGSPGGKGDADALLLHQIKTNKMGRGAITVNTSADCIMLSQQHVYFFFQLIKANV